jgi:hypothetical protein
MKKSKPLKMKATLPLLDKWDGTPESKTRLHRDAQLVLRALAMEFGLKKDEFRVCSNPLGPAIGGDIYFDAPTMRIWINGGYGFEIWGESDESKDQSRRVDSYVTARRCKGKDVDCEHDLAVDWELLWDITKLVEVLRLEGFVE